MAKGFSLHFGLNRISPTYYGGWDGLLNSCIADAEAMATIAQKQNFSATRIFIDDQATIACFVEGMDWLINQSLPGDLVLITFSGHGGSIMDRNNDERDGMDETWLFFDGQVVDDYIFKHLKRFKSGIRVVVVSDSCHSGSIIRNKEDAKGIPIKKKPLPLDEPKAGIVLLAASQDSKQALTGETYSLFTGELLKVWDQGRFAGNYKSFLESISKEIPFDRPPNYMEMGNLDNTFLQGKVFGL